jgi:hypothetical protein
MILEQTQYALVRQILKVLHTLSTNRTFTLDPDYKMLSILRPDFK